MTADAPALPKFIATLRRSNGQQERLTIAARDEEHARTFVAPLLAVADRPDPWTLVSLVPADHDPRNTTAAPEPARNTKAYRCEACSGIPSWCLRRQGDAAVTWACGRDLAAVLATMQRPHETTAVTVTRHHAIPAVRLSAGERFARVMTIDAHRPTFHRLRTEALRDHRDVASWTLPAAWDPGIGDDDEPVMHAPDDHLLGASLFGRPVTFIGQLIVAHYDDGTTHTVSPRDEWERRA